MLSNYEVSRMFCFCAAKLARLLFLPLTVICNFLNKVLKLLTDLKEQRKDSGKSKHTAGHQNLNTIMYEVGFHPLQKSIVRNIHVYNCGHRFLTLSFSGFLQTLKYLSKTPCSRQSPEIVKEFLTTMMPQKLTK